MNGDDESWGIWLDRHGPALLLLARQRCRSRADAEDAVQDGFVRFWKSRDQARDATAYLFACVRSAAIDLSRGSRRRVQHENRVELNVSSFEDAIEHDELRAAVDLAMATLPPEQREVLVLKIWARMTFAQIGESLSIPDNTAASRYRYALARLETLLSKEAVP